LKGGGGGVHGIAILGLLCMGPAHDFSNKKGLQGAGEGGPTPDHYYQDPPHLGSNGQHIAKENYWQPQREVRPIIVISVGTIGPPLFYILTNARLGDANHVYMIAHPK